MNPDNNDVKFSMRDPAPGYSSSCSSLSDNKSKSSEEEIYCDDIEMTLVDAVSTALKFCDTRKQSCIYIPGPNPRITFRCDETKSREEPAQNENRVLSAKSSSSSMQSVRLYTPENRVGQTSKLTPQEILEIATDEMIEMFSRWRISSGITTPRVCKVFNVKTWRNAIYEDKGPDNKARLLPIEMAWMFQEFRESPQNPRKRYADWYTTDYLPQAKKRN